MQIRAKNRWKKHRMVNSDFLGKVSKILTNDGIFSFRTDHREYLESAHKLIKDDPNLKITFFSQDLYSVEDRPKCHPTEFEMLFRSKGEPIGMIEAILVQI